MAHHNFLAHTQSERGTAFPTSAQRTRAAAVTARPHPVMQLQRTLGNRAVQRPIEGARNTALREVLVSPEERDEAVAAQTLRVPGGGPLPLATALALQRTIGNAGVRAIAQRQQAHLGDRITRSQGQGEPLDPATRTQLGGALGADLSGVRVHRDREADVLARSLRASAFTTGHDIYLGSSVGGPATSDGQRIVAHEAAHVVQQARGPVPGVQGFGGVQVSEPDDPFEVEAEAAADAIVRGEAFVPIGRQAAGTDGATTVQRCGGMPCTDCNEDVHAHGHSTPAVQRSCDADTGECGEEESWWDSVVETVSGAASDAGNWASETAGNAWDVASGAASDAWGTVSDATGDPNMGNAGNVYGIDIDTGEPLPDPATDACLADKDCRDAAMECGRDVVFKTLRQATAGAAAGIVTGNPLAAVVGGLVGTAAGYLDACAYPVYKRAVEKFAPGMSEPQKAQVAKTGIGKLAKTLTDKVVKSVAKTGGGSCGATLVQGCSGAQVAEAQQKLNDAGAFPPLTVDGQFGPGTRRAVVAFQQANGLNPDGAIGPQTKAALGISAGAVQTQQGDPFGGLLGPSPF